jgi:beta-phosphoglucomutase family hydrolase
MHTFIFDMDGTLADTMPTHQLAWDALLPELGIELDRDEFFSWSAGLTNREIFPRLLGEDMSVDEINRLSEHKESLFRKLYQSQMSAIIGAEAFLQRATAAGYRRGVGTAAPPLNVDLVLDGLDLRRHFETVVCNADVKRGKPDPEIFLLAAERLGARPADCVVFEDAPAGIEAARRAGMACVVVTTTLTREQIAALDDTRHVVHVVDNFVDPELASLFASSSR